MEKDKAIPILGVSRHRLKTDGESVITLIAFYGCPLHCKYCINPQCHITESAKEKLLFDVMIGISDRFKAFLSSLSL